MAQIILDERHTQQPRWDAQSVRRASADAVIPEGSDRTRDRSLLLFHHAQSSKKLGRARKDAPATGRSPEPPRPTTPKTA